MQDWENGYLNGKQWKMVTSQLHQRDKQVIAKYPKSKGEQWWNLSEICVKKINQNLIKTENERKKLV